VSYEIVLVTRQQERLTVYQFHSSHRMRCCRSTASGPEVAHPSTVQQWLLHRTGSNQYTSLYKQWAQKSLETGVLSKPIWHQHAPQRAPHIHSRDSQDSSCDLTHNMHHSVLQAVHLGMQLLPTACCAARSASSSPASA